MMALQNKLTLMIQQAPLNSPWAEIKAACDTRRTRGCGCEVDVTTDVFKAIDEKAGDYIDHATGNTRVLQFRLQKIEEFDVDRLAEIVFGECVIEFEVKRATKARLTTKMVQKIDRKYFT